MAYAFNDDKSKFDLDTFANTLAGTIATIETSPVTNNHAIGDRILYNNVLYRVIAPIAAGENLIVNANITSTNVSYELDNVSTLKPVTVEPIHPSVGFINKEANSLNELVYINLSLKLLDNKAAVNNGWVELAECYTHPFRYIEVPATLFMPNDSYEACSCRIKKEDGVISIFRPSGMPLDSYAYINLIFQAG